MKASILLNVAPLAVQATSGRLPLTPARGVASVQPTVTSSIDPNTVSKDWLQRPETKSQFQTQSLPNPTSTSGAPEPPKTFSTIETPTVKPSPPSRTSHPVASPSKSPQAYHQGPPPRYNTKAPHKRPPKLGYPTKRPLKVTVPKRPSPTKFRPHRPAQTQYPVRPGPSVRRDNGAPEADE
ncbi:hypothetical protein AB5N19_07488 [Seiridium cardinale]|uniref:Uncharacterized protein n=1 Tax=Seiridium cardinale TaxID=138064 RepID=A0ABR2XSV7_9PEZI